MRSSILASSFLAPFAIVLSLSQLACDDDALVPSASASMARYFRFDERTGLLELVDESGRLVADLSSLERDGDADPENERIDSVVIEDNALRIVEDGRVHAVDLTPLRSDADSDPTNELLTDAALEGTDLVLRQGTHSTSVDLSALLQDDADADPTNELQSLAYVDGILTLVGGNSIELPLPPVQTLSLAADGTLSISGGNSVPLPFYQRTIIVSPTADAFANGALLESKLTQAAAMAPTADRPVRLELEPGTYHLDSRGLTTVPHVHIVGAGIENTRITSNVIYWQLGRSAVVELGSDSTLSRLTVEHIGAPDQACMGVLINTPSTGSTVVLREVAIVMRPASCARHSVVVEGGLPSAIELHRVRIGTPSAPADFAFTDVSTYQGAPLPLIVRDSSLYALRAVDADHYDVRITNTLMSGNVLTTNGDIRCVSAFDENFVLRNPDCT